LEAIENYSGFSYEICWACLNEFCWVVKFLVRRASEVRTSKTQHNTENKKRWACFFGRWYQVNVSGWSACTDLALNNTYLYNFLRFTSTQKDHIPLQKWMTT
jgi:hypothetical protein